MTTSPDNIMSTEPSPPPAATDTAQGVGDRTQDPEDPDISMTPTSTPTTARPESQDTISSHQPPTASQQQTEVEDEEARVLKQEEQDEDGQGLSQNSKDSVVKEGNAVGSGEMEGVVLEVGAGGADEQLSEQEGHQQTKTTAPAKRTKGATSKSKKLEPKANTNRNEDDQEGEEDAEEDEDGEDRKLASTTKTQRNGENNDEDDELSLSSDDDDGEEDNEDEEGGAGSGQHPNDDEYSNLPEETLCRWKDCGKVLPSLAALVIHLSDEHIGWKKTAYTCEWQGCARRPIAQTTRFALISHMRSHTKHKPYDCPVPECDKSFSRSEYVLILHWLIVGYVIIMEKRELTNISPVPQL
ncbi:MAG: hypothetical protein J3R72DRAFT_240744 [Linnemannia gamsii]|nr:MAG: hypothetical protein J3R72DRAFT_240744 [Linnemannia gamsii]